MESDAERVWTVKTTLVDVFLALRALTHLAALRPRSAPALDAALVHAAPVAVRSPDDRAALDAVRAMLAESGRHDDTRRIGELADVRADLVARMETACAVQAKKLGAPVSMQRMQGYLRAYFRKASVWDVAHVQLPEVHRLLEALMFGRLVLEDAPRSPPTAKPSDPRQIPLWGP